MAGERGWYTLVGKAQFFRGLCALDERRWTDARWCFALASHTKGYGELVGSYVEVVEWKREMEREFS